MNYGDIINVAISPGLEQAIAQALEDWVLELSEKEDIDLLEEQFYATRKIMQILIENQSLKDSDISAYIEDSLNMIAMRTSLDEISKAVFPDGNFKVGEYAHRFIQSAVLWTGGQVKGVTSKGKVVSYAVFKDEYLNRRTAWIDNSVADLSPVDLESFLHSIFKQTFPSEFVFEPGIIKFNPN